MKNILFWSYFYSACKKQIFSFSVCAKQYVAYLSHGNHTEFLGLCLYYTVSFWLWMASVQLFNNAIKTIWTEPSIIKIHFSPGVAFNKCVRWSQPILTSQDLLLNTLSQALCHKQAVTCWWIIISKERTQMTTYWSILLQYTEHLCGLNQISRAYAGCPLTEVVQAVSQLRLLWQIKNKHKKAWFWTINRLSRHPANKCSKCPCIHSHMQLSNLTALRGKTYFTPLY